MPPFDLAANGKTFKLTAMFPLAVASDFDLVVKYESASVANAALTYQDNVAVIKALVVKYPELRDVFDGVIARAVEPAGRDYGSMLLMKDIKVAGPAPIPGREPVFAPQVCASKVHSSGLLSSRKPR